MTESQEPSTKGNVVARALLGLAGATLVLGGMAVVGLIVTSGPLGFLAATPGLLMIAFGVILLFACAFYDDVSFKTGRFGVPALTRSRGEPSTDSPADKER